MDYKTVMKNIEKQKKNEELSAKLYRYAGLIQAVDYFSQKLNFDQIFEAAFDFVNELLILEKSALFVLSEDKFELSKIKGYENSVAVIKNSSRLQSLATRHGTLIHDNNVLERFFKREEYEPFQVETVIPFIMEDTLYGFIFTAQKTGGVLNADDYLISEALMRLINNALENFKIYGEIQNANRELDEKVFNLFAINQSSKALLSELNLETLYNLSIDVFSELTQSSVTGFLLYDANSEKYQLRACKDIFSNSRYLAELSPVKCAAVDINRIIIDCSNESDLSYFRSLFAEGFDGISCLKPEYIVLLIKNGCILGLVSLGKNVTGIPYKKSVFELIESLASATYIALSNAQLFRQVNEQKKVIQGKLEKVITLNKLMKNINSSLNVETLVDLTVKTLKISFDVEKCFFALYDQEKNSFKIVNTLGFETSKRVFKPGPSWKKVFEGDTVFETAEAGLLNYFGKKPAAEMGPAPGVVLVPIFIDKLDVELIGVIAVFKYGKALIGDEENMLTIETIAGHIAPVISNLKILQEQKKFLKPNFAEQFKKDFKEITAESTELDLDLDVIKITDSRSHLFKGNNMIKKLNASFKKVYPFSDNTIFILEQSGQDIEKRLQIAAGNDSTDIDIYKLGRDFKNYRDFYDLF